MSYKTTELSMAARARVRERLQQRDRSLQLRASSRAFSEDGFSRVVAELSTILGVDAGYLRPDETLGQALRVHRSELPSEVHHLFPALGLHDVVDPFAFALLDMVEGELRRDPSKQYRRAFTPTPKSEAEWVSRLLNLTVAEFVEALA